MKPMHSARFSRLVRCLLVISAWQAPLPFWHSHGTLADTPPDMPVWLASHLRAAHKTVDPQATVALGWHLHFALPAANDSSPDAPARARDPLAALTVAATAAVEVADLEPLPSPAATNDTRRLTAFRVPPGTVPSGGGSFFRHYAPEIPLPLRLGVSRS